MPWVLGMGYIGITLLITLRGAKSTIGVRNFSL